MFDAANVDSPLHSSRVLTIRGTAPRIPNPFFAGQYYDPEDRPVGSYIMAAPPRKRWNGEPTISVTDILDNDSDLFMRILRRPFRPWSGLGRRQPHRGQYVIADPDETPVGVLRRRLLLKSDRLDVRADIEGWGIGRIEEDDRTGSDRVFRVRDERSVAVATVTARFEGQFSVHLREISIEHTPDARAAWRCTTLALATCLPQFGINTYVGSGR